MGVASLRSAGAPARVLIVDDSAVARAVIARIIDGSEGFAVAGAVPNAHAALAFLAAQSVDFVLLDIEMPGVDGLTALPDVVEAAGSARVIVVSSADEARVGGTLHALALGAVDRVAKPGQGLSGGFDTRLLAKLTALSSEPAPPSPARSRPGQALPQFDPSTFDVIAIGASTGGIHALSSLLRAVPADMRLPILVTQHLPGSFMPYFAAQVAVLAGRPCDVATDRMRIRPARVIVAPGEAHLRCVALADGGAAIRLDTSPAASGCMPSVDPMLTSLADTFGPRVLAVMLSGMGRDGADGARRVAAVGGTVLAQDRESSVVWGMPGAVAAIAAAQLDPTSIGALVAGCGRP